MKKRTIMLNVSLILGAVYHVLFIAGYLLQKPLFGRIILELPPDTLERLEPTYFMSVIAVAAAAGAGFAVFNVLMRKNVSKGLFVGAVVFSGCAYIAERLVDYFAPTVAALNGLAALHGEIGVISFQLSRSVILCMETLFSPLFAAAVALMCCAGCVKDDSVKYN